jgi:hypothetical protein
MPINFNTNGFSFTSDDFTSGSDSTHNTDNSRTSSSDEQSNWRGQFNGFPGGFFRGATNVNIGEGVRFTSNGRTYTVPPGNYGNDNFTSGSRHSFRTGNSTPSNDVEGDVENLAGTTNGSVRGNVGRLQGTVMGSVFGNVENLNGTVMGGVTGNIGQMNGTVMGDVRGYITSLTGTIMGNVYGTIRHNAGDVMGRIYPPQQTGGAGPSSSGGNQRTHSAGNANANNRRHTPYPPQSPRTAPSASASASSTTQPSGDKRAQAHAEVDRLNGLPDNASNYAVLNLPKNASQTAIKSAWKQQTRILGPLVQQNATLPESVNTAQARLNAAYTALTNQGGNLNR